MAVSTGNISSLGYGSGGEDITINDHGNQRGLFVFFVVGFFVCFSTITISLRY